jgi:hypothetical protein
MNKYFYGNKISEYGVKNGYVDYAALAKCFDAILSNDFMANTCNIGYWEQITGFSDEDYYPEIFQYYIISSNGVDILKENNEIIFYNDVLNLYVWGVTHFGTSWDHVLTDIKIDR